MRRQRPTYSALVRFVHARCGLHGQRAPRPSEDVEPRVECLALSDSRGLAAAVQENRPVIIRGLTFPTSCQGDLLPQIRELCGWREVVVRQPGPNHSRPVNTGPKTPLPVDSTTAVPQLTFGDARAAAPYRKSVCLKMTDVLDELEARTPITSPSLEQQLTSEDRGPCSSSASATQEKEGIGEGGETTICSTNASAPGLYAANLPLKAALPELARHLRPIQHLVSDRLGQVFGHAQVPGTPVLYLGSGGQRTPLHFDPTENLTIVLQGSKRFRLFPPAASWDLQARGGLVAAFVCWLRGIVPAVYSDIDVWFVSPSQLPRFVDVILDPGDVLYLPAAWWHAVEGSNEPNVTLVFGYIPSA